MQKTNIYIAVAVVALLVVGFQTFTLATLSMKLADTPLGVGTAQAKVFSSGVELPDMAGGC